MAASGRTTIKTYFADMSMQHGEKGGSPID